MSEHEFPERIGKYQLGESIGSGSFSSVVIAIDTETNTKFVAKIIKKDRIINKEDEERFQREINAMVYLRHDNVITLRDFFSDNMNFYLIEDYCCGGELFEFIIKEQKIDEFTAAIILNQILDAVEYCHQHGVAHRDLKPENVLITEFPKIKVADFGLCGYIQQDKMKTFCGSPCYSAPECLCRVKYDGSKADIWSMGIILYSMVTGEFPWNITNTSMMLRQILKASFYIPEYLSPEIVDLLSNILQPHPSKRYSISDIRNHVWMKQYFPQVNQIHECASLPNNQMVTLKEFSMEFSKYASHHDHGIFCPLHQSTDHDILKKKVSFQSSLGTKSRKNIYQVRQIRASSLKESHPPKHINESKSFVKTRFPRL